MRSRASLARIVVVAALLGGCGGVATSRVTSVPTPAMPDPSIQAPAVQAPSPGTAVARRSCAGRGDPDLAGTPWQERPGTTEPSTVPAAMDTRHGVIVALEPVAFPGETSVTWTFDVCTNTWSRMSPATGPEGDMYRLVYHQAADVILAIPHWTGPMWAYSVPDDAWTRLPESFGRPTGITDVAYDPDRATVMAWSDFDGALYQYELADNDWTRVSPLVYPSGVFTAGPTARDVGGSTLWYSLLAYDTLNDDLVLTMLPVTDVPGATWLFHADSWSWTKAAKDPPFLNFGYGEFGGEVAYDSAHGTLVIDALGYLAAYTSADAAWTLPDAASWTPGLSMDPSTFEVMVNGEQVRRHLTRGPLARSWPTLVYDPINERIVVLGGTSAIADPTVTQEEQWIWWILADVWAYDVATNRWSELLTAHTPPVMSGHYTE